MNDQGEYRHITVGYIDGVSIRTDRYLSDNLNLCPRSKIKDRVSEITVNGKAAKFSAAVKNGDRLDFFFKPETVSCHSETIPRPEKIDFTVLYEDDATLIIDKPYGIVVHPAPGNATGTLVNGIVSYLSEEERLKMNNEGRPGIVHRLDKDTSGVLLVAKNLEALEYYGSCFRNRLVKKEYRAILRGILPSGSGEICRRIVRHRKDRKRFTVTESPDCGRDAVTVYREQKRWKDRYSTVALFPVTGRTHQLRVHMQSMGAPILGDPVYGRRDALFPQQRLMLHAYRLTVVLWGDGRARTFEAPLPPVFAETEQRLNEIF